jgi:hypothetical protein
VQFLVGQVTLNLCFCILWDLWVTSCILVSPGSETLTHYFSCLGGPDEVSIKTVRLHVMPNLCFCIRCIMRVT